MSTTYTPTIPPSNALSNIDLNAFGSNYASSYGHNVTGLIKREVQRVIYDAAPKGYFTDLQILMAKPREKWLSDEQYYDERTFGRKPVVATANVAGATQTQVIPVTNLSTSAVSVNVIITYPNNQKATVIAVDPTANTITAKAYTNQVLPAVTANDVISFQATMLGDSRNRIDTYSRIDVIERYNYIQQFARATRFGQMELYKYKNAGTTNYLDENKRDVMDQYRIDISNSYWNGDRGEAIMDDGTPTKTMGGVYPSMTAAGSPNTTTTTATIGDAVEDIVLGTQFGNSSQRKFLYATPTLLHALSKFYKSTLTRYTPDNMLAKLELSQIEMQGGIVVLVPVQRFQEASCFPASFANRMILVDQENITCAEAWGENIVDETPDINSGINQNTYKDFYVTGQLSIKMPNPLSNGWIDVV